MVKAFRQQEILKKRPFQNAFARQEPFYARGKEAVAEPACPLTRRAVIEEIDRVLLKAFQRGVRDFCSSGSSCGMRMRMTGCGCLNWIIPTLRSCALPRTTNFKYFIVYGWKDRSA